uniref:Uncharacterized protein n=1 Tax=Avena sativa TaxID=4498 RepID=A0ACD5ZL38_AVESA
MANSCVFHRSAALPALVVLSVLAIFASDVEGENQCPPFSCGDLHNISYPFRRPGDPAECGVASYELACSNSKAIIYINTGTYYVTGVNYTGSYFWVIDANIDMNSSCPLPQWNQLPYPSWRLVSSQLIDLITEGTWACFLNCSRAIKNNSRYKPVTCLSTISSFVYVSASGFCSVGQLEPSCGYLAMIPFGPRDSKPNLQGQDASYAGIAEFMRKGFAVGFPVGENSRKHSFREMIRICLNNSTSYFKEQISDASILHRAQAFFWSDIHFLECLIYGDSSISLNVLGRAILSFPKFFLVLCRFVLAPLVVMIFLAFKHWKTRITIDAVEKFLRMQEMLGPMRYAYTDITAITSHFRDKLGQGGYGSVYKGVLLPGDVYVAVKMLEGKANCDGEDFISEVSTIGRIHHINVVRLVGFCSEETRRALVYEYMPQGSLDKYIFSSEKSFSWDKLHEIALGIARGLDYLHQGCEMQILHFDIKPHNILLDSNFVPKVADFGLAKLYPRGNSFVPLSVLRGTVGYIAPEMISRSFGVISSKSDVYSFGMLLLEMAGGRRNADSNAANSSQAYYPSWVYDRLTEQGVGEISLAAEMHELERKLCIVGLWCIQMKSHDRPAMSEVIEMLEAGVDGLKMPSRPFFCDEGHIHVEDSYHLSSELTAISEEDEENAHLCSDETKRS